MSRPGSWPTVMLGIAAGLLLAGPSARGNVTLPRHPSISPDGMAVVFSWHGDLWRAPVSGGTAARLTTNPADEVESAWSADGEWVAFTSNRTGAANLYVMRPDGTEVRAVTDIDRDCTLGGFGVDDAGQPVLTFDAVLEGDVYRSWRPYLVALDGGPLRRVHDAFGAWPRVSPDGRRVAFVRGGYYYVRRGRRNYRGPDTCDLWIFDRDAATFTQVTRAEATDAHPRWAGDGTLLFLSDRDGAMNLYRLRVVDGDANAQRLTSFDRDVHGFDVTPSGERAVVAVWDTLYAVDLGAGAGPPRPIALIAPEDEEDGYELKEIGRQVSEAQLSPDGKVMAVVAYGEVFVRHVDEDSPTRRVTRSAARERDIAWSPDGMRLYFTSDRDGTESIYAASVQTTRGEIKKQFAQTTGITDPLLDLGAPEDDGAKAGGQDGDEGDDGDEGAEGEHDAGGAEGAGGDEADEPGPERWHDAVTFAVEAVVQRATSDRSPSPSPDGRRLAFRSTRGTLEVLDLQTGAIATLHEHWDFTTDWRWSPDGRHIAYAQSDLDFNSDIHIVDAAGAHAPVNITRHPDNDLHPRFSADGRLLAFVSDRVNDGYDVWYVHLDRDLDALSAQDRKAYYEAAGKAAGKRKPLDGSADDQDDEQAPEDEGGEGEPPPFELDRDLSDAYLRLRRLTSYAPDERQVEITPGGDRVIFSRSGEGAGIYSVKWDGSEEKKLAEGGSITQVSLTGDKLVLVDDGRAAVVPPGGGELERIDVTDRIEIDLGAQASQKFLEAARGLGEGFYSPTMNGVDWEALTERYHALARDAFTADEFNWVANRLIGELNGSHLAVRGGQPPVENARSLGRLGTTHRRVDDGWEITEVVPHGPADQGPMALKVGDVITAIEFEPFERAETVESRLVDRTGVETTLSIRRALDDGAVVDVQVLLTPVSYRDESQLRYRAWRRRNADLVREWSGGRVGYIHLQGMSQPSLDVFERDLHAAAHGTDGLLVDVRNNGGGWTTDRVLSSIMVREHAYTIPRGADPQARGHYPQDRLFIQRYTNPVNLLCNEKSFSNAEIMSHAFKTLRRGTLVGQVTYGGVISTGGWSLIDGTWVRLPFRGWYLADGTNHDMELNGAVPDLIVEQTPEDESRGFDAQLKAAVDDLLGRLD